MAKLLEVVVRVVVLGDVSDVLDCTDVDGDAGETAAGAVRCQCVLERTTRAVVALRCNTNDTSNGGENNEEVERSRFKSSVQVPRTLDLGTQTSRVVGKRHLLENRVAENHGTLNHTADGRQVLDGFNGALDIVLVGNVAGYGPDLASEVAQVVEQRSGLVGGVGTSREDNEVLGSVFSKPDTDALADTSEATDDDVGCVCVELDSGHLADNLLEC